LIKGKGQIPIIVNGVSDHIHVFLALRPSMLLSDLVRDIKNNSSKFINEQGWTRHKFSWQEGYGAFSYSHSQVPIIYNYILNQEQHHHKKSFQEEYREFMKEFEIDFDEKYLFDGME